MPPWVSRGGADECTDRSELGREGFAREGGGGLHVATDQVTDAMAESRGDLRYKNTQPRDLVGPPAQGMTSTTWRAHLSKAAIYNPRRFCALR